MGGINLSKLINSVISSEILSNEDKVAFVKLLTNGDLNRGIFIHEGFYLKGIDENVVQCWYRNVDPSQQTMHGNTGWSDPNMIIKVYLETTQKNKTR